MADNNRNWENQSRQSGQNWEQSRNRFNEENKNRYQGNNEDYGGAGYNNDWEDNRNRNQQYRNTGNQYNSGNQSNYNRANYIPDNDENRNERDRDYEDTQFGTSGTYGYKNEQGNDYNPGAYYKGNDQGSFGQSMNNRDDYGRREDWRRNNMNSGYDKRNERRGDDDRSFNQQYRNEENRYGNTGGMSSYRSDYDRNRNNYNTGMGNQVGNYTEGSGRGYEDRNSGADRGLQNRTEGQYTGGHRGKGPKDYSRSTDRIREDVCDRLSDDDYLDATDIVVQVEGNEVILSGMVQNREQKRRAEDLAESISGVHNVENRIRVGHYISHDYTGTTDKVGGIGNESGTTNEVIRDARKDQDRSRGSKNDRQENKR